MRTKLIFSSSSSVIFQAPKQSASLPDFFVMRRIVSVKLSLFFFSLSKVSCVFSVIEIVLVAILYVCVHMHRRTINLLEGAVKRGPDRRRLA